MRKILASPLVYKTVQKLFGSEGLRKTLSAEYLTLKNNDDLLDLGCGTGDILKFLPSINYTGIDSSEEYVNSAQKKFSHSAKFICSKFDVNSTLSGQYDCVIAVGLIHHLDDATSKKLILNSFNVLKKGGRLITIDNVLYKGQGKLARWIIKCDRGEYIRNLRSYTALFSKGLFNVVEFDLREDLVAMPYSHIISVCVK